MWSEGQRAESPWGGRGRGEYGVKEGREFCAVKPETRVRKGTGPGAETGPDPPTPAAAATLGTMSGREHRGRSGPSGATGPRALASAFPSPGPYMGGPPHSALRHPKEASLEDLTFFTTDAGVPSRCSSRVAGARSLLCPGQRQSQKAPGVCESPHPTSSGLNVFSSSTGPYEATRGEQVRG